MLKNAMFQSAPDIAGRNNTEEVTPLPCPMPPLKGGAHRGSFSMKSLAAALLAVLACQSALAETLEISGGTVPYADAIEPRLADIKALGIEIKFNGVGTGRGMLALVDGKVAMASCGDVLAEGIKAAKKAAAKENREITPPGNMVFTRIGTDEMVVVVHKGNSVTELSKAQLKDLATGKIANWREVGGPDLPVKVIVTEPSLAPGQFFQGAIMDGAPYATGATEVRSPKEVITWVSRTPGGFGVAPEPFMKKEPGDARQVKAPPLMRPLGLVTVGEPAGAAKKVADLLRVK